MTGGRAAILLLVAVLSAGFLAVVAGAGRAQTTPSGVGFARTDIPDINIGTAFGVGDFNNDGKPDMAVANFSRATVSILLGDGAGGFGAKHDAPVGAGALSVAVGNLGGDANVDLAVVNFNEDSLSLLVGDGAGGFMDAGVVGLPSIPSSVVSGDFNGDGLTDLATANLGADSVSVLFGDGAFGFTRVDFPVGREPRMITAADVNLDGALDLAVVNYLSDTASVLIGDGAGHFSRSDVPSGQTPRSVAAGDLNGDGKPDLVAGNYETSSVNVMIGDGTGGFTPSPIAVGTNPRSVAVADFNGDGNADLAVANHGTNDVSILLGDGAAHFTRSDVAVSTGPYALAVGDFKLDDRPDLVVANQDANSVSVLVNQSAAPTRPPVCALRGVVGGPPERDVMDVSDLGSGIAAIRVASATNAAVRIQPFPSLGQFTAVEVVASAVDAGTPAQVSLRVTDSAGAVTTCTNTPPPTTTTSSAITTTTVPGPPAPFVTSFTPTNLRQDFSGWVGSTLTVGASDLQVSSLGRWVVAGNAGRHVVKVVDPGTGNDLGSVTVDTAGAPAGTFRYMPLANPLILRANTRYYLVSQEISGGDTWYDYDTRLVTSPASGADTGVVYSFASSPTSWTPGGGPGNGYGPVNFLFTGEPAAGTSTTGATTTTSTPPTSTTPTTVAAGTPAPFVISFTPTNQRRDFSGWVGSRLTVGAADLQVSSLGRWVVAGNAGSHVVKVVDAATGNDLASATVDTAGAPVGAFRYAALTSPVTLHADGSYFLVSQETSGGDAWYDYDTRLVTSAAATDTGVVYSFAASPTSWAPGGSPGNGYGPVSFLFTGGPATPTTSSTTTTAPSTTPTTVAGGTTAFVTSFTPTNLRRDFSGWLGSRFTVGGTDLQVSSVGRWVVAGNAGSHVVKVVDATTGNDLASVTVDTAGATAGSFRYAPLTSPVTLRANASYYLVSQET
ncbi:MAG TPA: VCBS repeat-containing protein, partial [Acidimicrobiales bacterium]|nr:VCBS repeat-containing protein [Acidimicrobiales bacterium]